MKKIILLAICIFMIATLFVTGCQDKDDSGTTTTTKAAGTTTTQEPPVEISIFTWDSWYAPASYTSGLPVHKELEERLNIKFVWNVLPSSECHTVLNTRLAAGQDLEDMIGSAPNPMDLAERGLIVPFDQLIGEDTPNIVKLFEEMPGLKSYMTAADGRMYVFSGIVKGYYGLTTNWIRKDWLDKLDLEVPTNTDEYIAALKAFRENDVNGNGMEDEVYACSSNYYRLLSEIFHMHFNTGYYSVNEQGEAEFDYLEPRGKLFLEFANKMWNEGIFDREIVNMPYDILTGRLANNMVGAITWYPGHKDWLYDQVKGADPNADYVVAMIEGPFGMQTHTENPNFYPANAITKFADRLDKIMELMDYFWAGPEGFVLNNWGIEGLTYEVKNGERVFTDYALNNPDDLAFGDVMYKTGCYMHIANLQDQADTMPKRLSEAAAVEAQKVIDEAEPVQDWYFVQRTMEETDLISTFSADLNTYLDEMLTKFVIGEEPLSNYDDFSAQLRKLGVDEMLKIVERQYNDSK